MAFASSCRGLGASKQNSSLPFSIFAFSSFPFHSALHYLVSNLLIRTAIPSEQQLLESLQLRAGLANLGDRDALLAHPDAIAIPPHQIAAGRVFVAQSGDAIVGFAALELRPDGDTELDGLFVDPASQRRGIGRALVQHCAAFARSRRSAALHVIGNPHAQHFYTSCGFLPSGTAQTRFGPALLFRLSL
jgi:GNAT superfamily N-acetyltransferase